jgi:hypothetical protein
MPLIGLDSSESKHGSLAISKMPLLGLDSGRSWRLWSRSSTCHQRSETKISETAVISSTDFVDVYNEQHTSIPV